MIPTTTLPAEALALADRRRIDAACDRFEAAWIEGDEPDLAGFLGDVEGPARARLFRELLALDLDYRARRGDRPVASTYVDRFPEHAATIADAFDPASPKGWTVAGPAAGPAAEMMVAETLRGAGFEVVGVLGRGGMGVVYDALQSSLNRRVALKVIRSAGFATEGERLRFRNEAESVAMLDHPHVVPIYEVGERDGLHFFSMKRIDGPGLDKALESFGADPRASARAVAVAAGAVQHAHDRGILHRDLKPANILLDGRGRPHVTDFGLARRVEGDTGLTHSGALVGTPAYMAPEQAEGKKGEVTTATDVYGLGTILYALLAGRAPFAGSSLVETLDKVRAAPPEPPTRLNPRVPRDLELICLKCLEKDPRRRYPTAQALADDLHRWLAGEPIAARPVGSATRAAMWARRHPLPAALAGSLAIATILGLAGIAWNWRRAVDARFQADEVNEFLLQPLIDAAPKTLLDLAGERLGNNFQGRPEVEATLRERLAAAYLGRADHEPGIGHARRAIEIQTDLQGPSGPDTLRAADLLARLLDESGRPGRAETLARANLDACRRSAGLAAPATLQAADTLGVILGHAGKLDEAESLLRATLDARRRLIGRREEPTLRTVAHLCQLLLDRKRLDEAAALGAEYEDGIRCLWGNRHPDNVLALSIRGMILADQGQLAHAEPFYRRAAQEADRILGPDHPKTRAARDALARIARPPAP